MLKRAVYILLTSLLILSTVGFVVSRHYCNQILISVAVDLPADKCDDAMDGNCCHDDNEYVVLKTNFVQPAVEYLSITMVDVFIFEHSTIPAESVIENTNSNHFFTFLPPRGKHNFLSEIQSFLC